MNFVTHGDALTDPAPQGSVETAWPKVSTGLMLILVGDMVLLGGMLLGLAIVWLALTGGPLGRLSEALDEHREATLWLGTLTVGLGVLCGYALILAGQWRCRSWLAGRRGSRMVIAICLACFLLGSLVLTLAGLMDRGRNYWLLGQGPEMFARVSWQTPAGNLLLLGLTLLVGRFLLFNQFLRTIAGCWGDRARARTVDAYLVLVCLLLGATFGAFGCIGHVAERTEMFCGLAIGWLTCFIGHMYLVDGTRTCIAKGLDKTLFEARAEENRFVFASIPQRLSGMHRLARIKARLKD